MIGPLTNETGKSGLRHTRHISMSHMSRTCFNCCIELCNSYNFQILRETNVTSMVIVYNIFLQ